MASDDDNIVTIIFSTLQEVGELIKLSVIFVNKKGVRIIDGHYENCTSINPYDSNFLNWIQGLSIFILILLSFVTRRVSFLSKVCYGRPGPVVPMKPLDNHDNCLEYTLGFLAVSEFIYAYLFDESVKSVFETPIIKFLVQLAYVLIFSLLSYPIFAAITYRNLLAYIFGCVFLIVNLISSLFNLHFLTKCETLDKATTTTFKTLFSVLFMFVLLCILVRRIILHVIRNRCRLDDQTIDENNEDSQCLKYVKNFITRRSEESIKKTFLHNIGTKIRNEIYQDIPGFRVPPRLIIGLSMGSYFAYHIVIDKIDELTPYFWNFFRLLSASFSTTNIDTKTAFEIVFGNYSITRPGERLNAFRRVTFLYIHVVLSCVVSGLVLAFLNALINSFLALRNYRLHFHELTKRGRSIIIDKEYIPQPHELVLGFARFSGFQAAFILWSIMVVFTVATVLLFILIGIVIIPLIYIKGSYARSFVIYFLPVLILSFILNFMQAMLVKYVFVCERGKVMEINNKKAFDIYCHVAFFLNVLIGFFGSLKRVIVWLCSGIICFGRIDFSSLPDYIQQFDSGFMCYVGFLYTEQYHYNPVLRCFVHLLVNSKRNAQVNTSLSHIKDLEKVKNIYTTGRDINYRIKWWVAYTLIKNPQLISMQKIFKKDIPITETVI